MLDRNEVIKQAMHNCLKEMYAKSQPMADYDNLIEEYKSGKIGKDERIYERHYLSQAEFQYILKKYVSAYGLTMKWYDYVETVENYLKEGGIKDKYIHANEEGYKHPGYLSYEDVLPIKVQIQNYIDSLNLNSSINNKMSDDITNIVMNTISECKNFYRFDREQTDFECAVCLGASPTSNKESVQKWWKDNYNVDIEIEERNPLLFWEYDNYEDETDEIMREDYGENWKEFWDERWKEDEERKKKELDEKIKNIKEQYKEENNE